MMRTTHVPRSKSSDYPAPAFERAVRALDEYDACAVEYQMMLDTQRALLTAGNLDAAVETLALGDALARRAATCGRRIAPVREALAAGAYAGPRTSELQHRISQVRTSSDRIGSTISQLSAVCVVKRDAAAAELSEDRVAQAARSRMSYAGGDRPMAAIDIKH
jgi:hypothetical protein